MDRNTEILFLKLRRVSRTKSLIIIGEIYRLFCFMFVPHESSNFNFTNERTKGLFECQLNVTDEKLYSKRHGYPSRFFTPTLAWVADPLILILCNDKTIHIHNFDDETTFLGLWKYIL